MAQRRLGRLGDVSELRDVGDVGDVTEGRDVVPPFPRVREGPHVVRASSPAWDLTVLRVRRSDKVRFDLLRARRSSDGRIRPHWEVFADLLDEREGR